MNIGDFQHFRVFTETVDLPVFVDFLKTETDLLMIVKEFGKSNREHIHATLKLKTAKTTFLDRLKKKFPSIFGNKSYSLKPLRDFDKNARYCYKGVANDYPDILYTQHTEEEWKDYYNRYWNEFKENKKVVNTGCQNDSTFLVSEAKSKSKSSKSWLLKMCEELYDEHKPLFGSIWYHNGCKDFEPINTLNDNQDYLANYLLKKLGGSAKNIDDIIFERMYTGMYFYILQKCPQDLTSKYASQRLNKFRHKL